MAYTPFNWRDGSQGATPISAERLNAIEQGIANAASVADTATGNNTAVVRIGQALLIAPAPSGDVTGATDQAALQPLLLQAQNTRGTLLLQAGTYYVTGLVTAQSFNQPRIQGQGRDYTLVIGKGGVNSAAIKFQGGSGRTGGGGVSDVQISNPGGTALLIADATGTQHYRLVLDNANIGVQFFAQNVNAFCEFNVIHDSDFRAGALTAVRYSKSNGNESFHGSGLDNCLINSGATQSSVVIDAGCLPYQAPMTFNCFPTGTAPIIQNNNNGGARAPEFYGNIGVETSVNNVVLGGGFRFNFMGDVQMFGGVGMTHGTLVEIAAAYYNNAGAFYRRKPWAAFSGSQFGIGNSPSIVVNNFDSGTSALIDVTMSAPSYFYRYHLWVSHSPFDQSAGQITVLSTHAIANGAGYGPASNWLFSNYNLMCTISGAPVNASSPVRASSLVTPTGEGISQIL